jgi:hypothetical protein
MDCRMGDVTVTKAAPETPARVAVTVPVPGPAAVAKPPGETDTVVGTPAVHVTALVRFNDVPSVYVPIAVICSLRPLASD